MKPASPVLLVLLALAPPLGCSLSAKPFEPLAAADRGEDIDGSGGSDETDETDETDVLPLAPSDFQGRELLEINAALGEAVWQARRGGKLTPPDARAEAEDTGWLLEGRTSEDQGIWRDITPLVGSGGRYRVEGSAKLRGATSGNLVLEATLRCAAGSRPIPIAEAAGNDTDWTRLEGEFTVPADCDISSVGLEVAGPAQGVNLLVGGLAMSAQAPVNLVRNPGCESDAEGWVVFPVFGAAGVRTDTPPAFEGEYSCRSGSGNRPRVFDGLYYDLTRNAIPAAPYFVRAAIRHDSDVAETVHVKARLDCISKSTGADDDYYSSWGPSATVPANEWFRFEANSRRLPVDPDCDLKNFYLYVETAGGANPYLGPLFFDDVYVGFDPPL